MLRIDGDMMIPDEGVVSSAELREFANDTLNEGQKSHLEEVRDVDLAIEIGPCRFRANFFYTSDGLSAVLRKIETEIPSMAQLNLPHVMQSMAEKPNGLVLVTGPTGSGKSTSLAAIIDAINSNKQGHILTIEDPIEYIHHAKNCSISQREMGRDAESFASALRASLREDPDVILVGEMRDLETIQLALTAAETGHLVFGTLHTSGAPNTINRIIDVFPAEQQGQVRAQLSQSLQMVVTQKLFKKSDGEGRVAAFEVMVCNHAVRNLIREGKIFQIESVMQTARGEGMVTMKHALEQLLLSQEINQADVEVED
jgi:twitching motility protein PilT